MKYTCVIQGGILKAVYTIYFLSEQILQSFALLQRSVTRAANSSQYGATANVQSQESR